MSRFTPIVALVLVVLFGCDSRENAERQSSAEAAPDDTAGAAPRGVPRPAPDSFGELVTDVDRVVLTERTVLTLDDAGVPTGDDAHPAVFETTDSHWISRFVTAVGEETARTPLPDDCAPWADLTLYEGDEVVASMSVDCSRDEAFERFKSRGEARGYVGADRQGLAELLTELRR